MSDKPLFAGRTHHAAPPVFANREVALQKRARRHQYAGNSSGELTQIAVELCMSAARIKRFDTLGSHLFEIEAQKRHKVFGED